MRKFLLLLAAGGLVAGSGCNLLMLPFYLFGPEPKFPAEMHAVAPSPKEKDKKKENKVVILTYGGIETSTDFLHADREISRRLAARLQEMCDYNEEKVKVIDPRKVEEFKSKHPDWHHQHLELEEIGKHFGAEWVIYLEVQALSMYKPGSAGQLYRGQANLSVSLVNVHKPDDLTLGTREVQFTYPTEAQGGFLARDFDMPPHVFKTKFLDALARKLARNFAAYPTNQRFDFD